MEVRMSSLPSGSSFMNFGNGGYFVNQNTKQAVHPQVTLNLAANPPVLDTQGSKPIPSKASNLCGSTRRLGGQMWTQLRNVVNSIRSSGTPVTWVNPGMIQQFPPHSVQHSYQDHQPMLDMSHSANQPPLWYPATQGCYEYEIDPLQAFSSYPIHDMGYGMYQKVATGSPKNGFSKCSQPLNPEAEEWVPQNLKNRNYNVSSLPSSSVQNPPVIATFGFIEISDQEINEVRKDMENEKSKTLSNKLTDSQKTELLNKVNDQLKVSAKDNVNCSTSSFNSQVRSPDNGSNDHNKPDDGKVALGISLTYACITSKSPEPPSVSPTSENTIEKNQALSSECVKQPIPKIFMKDKKYPKEKAVPLMDTQNKSPLPFKTTNKSQKKSRKKFLKDLRDLSPAKSDCSFSGSEVGSLDSSSDFMSRLCMSSSPASIGSPGTLRKDKFDPSSKNIKSQRTVSESSASSGHNRTTSESSTGSVDSVDIEFDEGCDIVIENLNDCCTNPQKSKPSNSILAHILGLDSDSDDSEEETDSDWDNVDECESIVLDDSWETFGLSIPLITKSSSATCISKSPSTDEPDNYHSKNICDNDYVSFNLDDVNKCWDSEVIKDVKSRSPTRVRFGKANVHPMITWSFAYKNARKGPWEQYARDRARFSNRISAVESVLSPVLESKHREAMCRQLYGC